METFSKTDLWMRERLKTVSLVPACYITAEGWFYEVSAGRYAYGGPAPSDQILYPRHTPMFGTFYDWLSRDFPAAAEAGD